MIALTQPAWVKARVNSRRTRSAVVVDGTTNVIKQTFTSEDHERVTVGQYADIAGG